MKPSEAKDKVLNYLVAKCEGYDCNGKVLTRPDPLDDGALTHLWLEDYRPSTDWAQGGPIIEREGIALLPTWTAERPGFSADGPTPLVAAMRCYVASQLGDEIELPEELK